MTLQLFANPYDISAHGFYFSTIEEFDLLYKKNFPVEEYEIEFVDGDEFELKLFESMKCHQGSVSKYFEIIADAWNDVSLQAAICALLENGAAHADDVVEKAGRETTVFEGTLEDYVYDLVNDCYFDKNMPELLKRYFDYSMFANDLRIERSLYEYRFAGTDYVIDFG